jgi:putative restriction endonuclease
MDTIIRMKIFEFLDEQVRLHGDVLPFFILSYGFHYGGERIPLLGPQGIWKPALLDKYPISITSIPGGAYDDTFSDDSTLHYKYRGENPNHRDNVLMKFAMRDQIPLIYFHRVIKGKYLVHWPVYIAGADDRTLTFTVEADRHDSINLESKGEVIKPDDARRRYVTYEMKQRMHQQSFREKVLFAYHDHCALCRLRHRELLDAAHIVPDSEGGTPIVSNGLALCKIHHAAFDQNIIGITPDYIVKIRDDVLNEIDGPMLKHGLQGFNNQSIYVPRGINKPNRDFLAFRYERFMKKVV